MTLDDKIIEMYEQTGSVRATAKAVETKVGVVRKILISNGIIPTQKSETISDLVDAGLTRKQIAETLAIKEETVLNYLPYMRNPYNTSGNRQIRRKKEFKHGDNKMPYWMFAELLQKARESENYDAYYLQAKSIIKKNIYESEQYDVYLALSRIYEFAHDHTYKKLLELTGATNRSVARNYNIPPKTCEKWRAGTKSVDYLLDLLAADMLTQ